MRNHYHWLEVNLLDFFRKLPELKTQVDSGWLNEGIISAHGDKCYSYRDTWAKAGIPFEHGVAIYLLTYMKPWCNEADNWVVDNYSRFKDLLPPLEVEVFNLLRS